MRIRKLINFLLKLAKLILKLADTAGAYPGFLSMKPTRSIASPPGWDASPSQVTAQHFVAGNPFILLGVERGNFAQEHNTMTQARARTQTT